MKSVIKMLVMALTLTIASQAMADCYILVKVCAPSRGITPNVLFKDSDTSLLTQNEPNRCMQRAREYLSYCQPAPGDNYAASYFMVGGQWRTAVVVTNTTSQIYTINFAGQWSPLSQKSY